MTLFHDPSNQALASQVRLIAHEMRNQLQVVAGYLEYATNATDMDHPAADDMRSAHEALQLTLAVLQRMLSGAKELDPLLTNASNLLRHTAKLIRPLLDESIRVEVLVEEDLWITAEPIMIQEALINLCLNAKESMPSGGALTLSAKPRGSEVILSVSDSGHGMSKEQLRQCLENLYSTKGTNRGLGLPIVHEIVLQHKGKVEIESSPGVGSHFHLALPASPRRTDKSVCLEWEKRQPFSS